jgi:hypothetical protein
VSYPKECSIFYNASMQTITEETIVADWGECLEELTAIDKLHLLSILSYWQGLDTQQQMANGAEFTLTEAIDEYPIRVSEGVHDILRELDSDDANPPFDIMAAIANQIKCQRLRTKVTELLA